MAPLRAALPRVSVQRPQQQRLALPAFSGLRASSDMPQQLAGGAGGANAWWAPRASGLAGATGPCRCAQPAHTPLPVPCPAAAEASSSSSLAAPSNGGRVFAMRHGVKGARLGRPADQRKALIRGLVTEVLRHGKIKTTKVRRRAAPRPAGAAGPRGGRPAGASVRHAARACGRAAGAAMQVQQGEAWEAHAGGPGRAARMAHASRRPGRRWRQRRGRTRCARVDQPARLRHSPRRLRCRAAAERPGHVCLTSA